LSHLAAGRGGPPPEAAAAKRARRAGRGRLLASLLALGLAEPFVAVAADDATVSAPDPPVAIGAVEPAAPAATVAALPAGVRVLTTGGVDMEQAALLLSGQEGGALPLAAFASAVGPASGGVETLVVLEIAGAALLKESASPLYVDVCLYVLTGDPPAVTASVLQTVAIDLEQQGEVLADGGLQLVRRLVLPAGEHSLRVLVRNRANRDLALRVLPLSVPTFAAGTPALLGPFFAPSPGRWLLVPASAGPTAVPGPPATPPALPLIAVGGAAELQVVTSPGQGAGLEIELRRDGKTIAAVPAVVAERTPLAAGLELLTLSFDLPALPSGIAELGVRDAGGTVATRSTKVVLTEGTVAAAWPSLLAGAPVAPTAAAGAGLPAAPPRRGLGRLGERQVAKRYREALQQLAGDGAEAARAAVAALESEALSGKSVEPRELVEIELGVLAPLAETSPEALWPVLALYVDSHRQHLAARAGVASLHTQQMVLRLAALFAESAPPAARPQAAVPLLALVADLPASGEHDLRVRALAAAREYQPDDAAILLCIAVDDERHADYQGAIEALSALRRLAPDDREVRLRLGINHARLGSQRQARSELGAALRGDADPPPWWLPLAYQELGRLHLDGGDLHAAEGVLRQGLARLPREEKLSLLLAQVLERGGDAAAAVEVLSAVIPSPQDRGFDSARHRYVQLPRQRLERARAELGELAGAARPRLAAALAAAPGREASR
jgi:tetratricopeptide (TPR) repeat protein